MEVKTENLTSKIFNEAFMKNISPTVVENSMTYTECRELIATLFAEDKTTGPIQSPAMLNYTKMNIARMRRLDKTTRLSPETLEKLEKIDKPQLWLVLTEAWCGDAAQIVPVMNKMAEVQPNITLRFILRDENLEVMDAFLTNGGRSIPKLIVTVGEDNEVIKDWGPRPSEVQEIVTLSKTELAAIEDDESRKIHTQAEKYNVQKWYAADKTKQIQEEILS
ncbi:MAG: hypothetical protein ACI85O_000472 [Saprospiraceae bacterium]